MTRWVCLKHSDLVCRAFVSFICIPNPSNTPHKAIISELLFNRFIFQHKHSRPVSPALQWNATQMIEDVETRSCSQFSSLSVGKDDDTQQQLFPHQRRWRHFRGLSHGGTVQKEANKWEMLILSTKVHQLQTFLTWYRVPCLFVALCSAIFSLF